MPRKKKPAQTIKEIIEAGQVQPASELETPAAESPPPQEPVTASPETPARQPKSWGETVRGWHGYGKTGVHHVTTTSPDMVGLRFDRGKERTAEEKREMEAIGLRFYNDAQSWLKTNRDGAFDETALLARKFADRRRQMDAEYLER
jgi:hypothetical protein